MLGKTVRELMRPTELLTPEDSLGRAAAMLRRASAPLIPVVSEGRLIGAVTERGFAEQLAAGAQMNEPLDGAVELSVPMVGPYMSGAEALRTMSRTQKEALVVVEDSGRVVGLLVPSDLAPRRTLQPIPPSIGGMATPFGVYLTAGTVRAGASQLALVTAGMALATVMVFAAIASSLIVEWLSAGPLQGSLASLADRFLVFAIFAAVFRLLPLSGTHGAEHKVVHAIERGEELVPEVVERMPRVHPRCGTNYAAGAILFFGIATSPYIADDTVRLLVALFATLITWRWLGSAVQKWFTTKEPTRRQLEGAVSSGSQLLFLYARSRSSHPTVLQRIYHSGILHVLLGAFAIVFIADAILTWLKFPIPIIT